jgi:hypothetical protein
VAEVMAGTLTNVNSVQAPDADSKSIYTIGGKRIDRPQQGINIIDNKKVLLK